MNTANTHQPNNSPFQLAPPKAWELDAYDALELLFDYYDQKTADTMRRTILAIARAPHKGDTITAVLARSKTASQATYYGTWNKPAYAKYRELKERVLQLAGNADTRDELRAISTASRIMRLATVQAAETLITQTAATRPIYFKDERIDNAPDNAARIKASVEILNRADATTADQTPTRSPVVDDIITAIWGDSDDRDGGDTFDDDIIEGEEAAGETAERPRRLGD